MKDVKTSLPDRLRSVKRARKQNRINLSSKPQQQLPPGGRELLCELAEIVKPEGSAPKPSRRARSASRLAPVDLSGRTQGRRLPPDQLRLLRELAEIVGPASPAPKRPRRAVPSSSRLMEVAL